MLKQLTSLIRQDAAEVERDFDHAVADGVHIIPAASVAALLEPGCEILKSGEALKEVSLICIMISLCSCWLARHYNLTGPLSRYHRQ